MKQYEELLNITIGEVKNNIGNKIYVKYKNLDEVIEGKIENVLLSIVEENLSPKPEIVNPFVGIKVTIAEREKKLLFTDSTIEYIKF